MLKIKTLRGYLHTIHHSSKTNSKPTLKTNKTEEGALNKLAENKEQLQKPIETQTEVVVNSVAKATTKRGRFSLVPAKFQTEENEIKTNLVMSEKSSAKVSCKFFFFVSYLSFSLIFFQFMIF